MSQKQESLINKIILHKFLVSKQIGKGSFGLVYSGKNIETSEKIAIKIEDLENQTDDLKKRNILMKEARFMHEIQGEKGFPKMIFFSKTETRRILIMSLLGENLENLLKSCRGNFSLASVLLLADQIITRLESIHENEIIHRDLKPENLLIGTESNSRTIYLIDYGLAKKFMNKGMHVPFKENIGLVGTARYSSVNAHLGNEQSRRDDLESLGYILIYFLTGHLPWMNLIAKTKKEKHKVIIEKKIQTSVEELCDGLPKEFEIYMNYVKYGLKFDSEPNYDFMRKIFRNLLFQQHKEQMDDLLFDWEKNEFENRSNNSSNLGVNRKAESWNSFHSRAGTKSNENPRMNNFYKNYNSASYNRNTTNFLMMNTASKAGVINSNEFDGKLLEDNNLSPNSHEVKAWEKLDHVQLYPFQKNKKTISSLSNGTTATKMNTGANVEFECDFENVDTTRNPHNVAAMMSNLTLMNKIKAPPKF